MNSCEGINDERQHIQMYNENVMDDSKMSERRTVTETRNVRGNGVRSN